MKLLHFLKFGSREPPSARDRLRAAQLSREPAEVALAEASAARERVEAIVAAAEDAEDEAAAAETAVSRATRAWVEAGARTDTVAVDQALLDRMDQARRAAGEAAFKSTGAKAGLPAVRANEERARSRLSDVDHEVNDARCAMLLAALAPQFEALEQAGSMYAAAFDAIKSVEVITRAWGRAHEFGETANERAHRAIATHLAANYVHGASAMELRQMAQSTDRRLREQSKAWADYAKRLRADSDATF
jgi:hypothetical protein